MVPQEWNRKRQALWAMTGGLVIAGIVLILAVTGSPGNHNDGVWQDTRPQQRSTVPAWYPVWMGGVAPTDCPTGHTLVNGDNSYTAVDPTEDPRCP